MTELIIDRSAAPLEPVGDGWTLEGLAVPYDVEQVVSDDGGATTYIESFAYGAFSRDASNPAQGRWVNLMIGHNGDDGDRFLGGVRELREERDGLHARVRLEPKHPQAEAARSGELRGWSVSARVYRSRTSTRRGQTVTVREVCGLSHIAATPRPQYAGAGVLVAREHELIIGPPETPRLDAIRALLDGLPPRA